MPLSGEVQLSQNGLVPTARTLTNGVPLDVAVLDAAGNQLAGFDASRPSAAALTSVTVAAVSILLAAANPARRQLVLFNDGGNIVYVAFAATATTTAFTVRVPANGSYETVRDGYTGDVSAIRASGTGAVRVTEITT